MNFGKYVNESTANGNLVIQPRMGVMDPRFMRQGLSMVKSSKANTVGTITVDSYTRTRNLTAVEEAITNNQRLNGYPIVTHSTQITKDMLSGIQSEDFPIQVRHGSALPLHIFEALIKAKLDATEGGPISYCLPYGQIPLSDSIPAWKECCQLINIKSTSDYTVHLESFGGCMLGQLCPPSLLIALSVLECIFFGTYGVRSVSLSYAQQTSIKQDIAALLALRKLAEGKLTGIDWHIVLYAYMGVFPATKLGCEDLQESAVRLAKAGNADRLIVKTTAESLRIPTFEENIEAIETSQKHWELFCANSAISGFESKHNDNEIYLEAKLLIEEVLSLDSDIDKALLKAFKSGLLDVPYCLHKSNRGETRSMIDQTGQIRWASTGRMPVLSQYTQSSPDPVEFLSMLNYTKRQSDRPYLNKYEK